MQAPAKNILLLYLQPARTWTFLALTRTWLFVSQFRMDQHCARCLDFLAHSNPLDICRGQAPKHAEAPLLAGLPYV
jgi:hypothetical protein